MRIVNKTNKQIQKQQNKTNKEIIQKFTSHLNKKTFMGNLFFH